MKKEGLKKNLYFIKINYLFKILNSLELKNS
jgi:hypothetical protein